MALLKSLGNKIGKGLAVAAPLAAMVPGPIGMAGMAVGALAAARMGQVAASQAARAAPAAGMAMLPPLSLSGAPSAAGGLSALTAGFGVGGLMTAGGQLVRRVANSKRIAALAKSIGITGASTALGIGVAEVATAVMQDSTRGRRGRGITAAQLRTTRRTINKVVGMHAKLDASFKKASAKKCK